MKYYKVIGLMSGSSIDGLDIVFCRFNFDKSGWHYRIDESMTIPYPAEWQNILTHIREYHSSQFLEFHRLYGDYLGKSTKAFIEKYHLFPDIIASHGHTVFHNPTKGYTFQLGIGQAIAAVTGITTICNFRTKDIILHGQGAPLTPIGDALLFSEYNYCLNLGGIANISYDENGNRKGFDVCPANQLLNYLSRQLGEQYDKNGRFASLGKLHKPLFDAMNNQLYYFVKPPKSLSNENVEKHFFSLLNSFEIPVEDKLYTVVKHIAFQINSVIQSDTTKNIIVTGGGAHNLFLMKALHYEKGHNFIVPSRNIVDFKEAIIFALMGVLRVRGEINCFASVTGASQDCSAGEIYYP